MKRISLFVICSLLLVTALVSQVKSPPPPPPADENIFRVVEVMPLFPGCTNEGMDRMATQECGRVKMLEYVYANLKYPKEAKKKGIEGQVYIQFIVRKDGSISDAKIIRDPGGGCGEAALAVVNSMNDMPKRWTPGKQRGEAVDVQFLMPFSFRTPKEVENVEEEKGKKGKRVKKNKKQRLKN